jgi:hypothetical protein
MALKPPSPQKKLFYRTSFFGKRSNTKKKHSDRHNPSIGNSRHKNGKNAFVQCSTSTEVITSAF